jgi:hypothetical protein
LRILEDQRSMPQQASQEPGLPADALATTTWKAIITRPARFRY